MAYSDPEKQKEANRRAAERVREKKKAQGMTENSHTRPENHTQEGMTEAKGMTNKNHTRVIPDREEQEKAINKLRYEVEEIKKGMTNLSNTQNHTQEILSRLSALTERVEALENNKPPEYDLEDHESRISQMEAVMIEAGVLQPKKKVYELTRTPSLERPEMPCLFLSRGRNSGDIRMSTRSSRLNKSMDRG